MITNIDINLRMK